MAKIPQLTQWANAVKTRDGKCQECEALDDLHAHHIKPKATNPELKLVLENGMTLCYRCHKAEHEKNRAPRIRSNKPQRRTLNAEIGRLNAEIKRLNSEIDGLHEIIQARISENKKMKYLIGECTRGVCQTSVVRRKTMKAIDAT